MKLVDRSYQLAVDANGGFDLPTSLRYTEALAPYHLKWFEEPGDPLDYALIAESREVSATPIATGKNLFSMSYGLVGYLRTLDMPEKNGWPPWLAEILDIETASR